MHARRSQVRQEIEMCRDTLMSVCFSLVSPAGEEGQWRDRDEIVQASVLPKARVGEGGGSGKDLASEKFRRHRWGI